ncbi:MAG TPA: MbtH family NRPS accessory protein [Actinocrinis sp.]|nr:MbtH family NRPS accessory protein [Actinocrinis sp.]
MSTEDRVYRVVVNHEEQYSIWPADGRIPDGWSEEGFSGAKDDCLGHITLVWTDLRPRSLRERLAAGAEGGDRA